jgi:uncharacterized membrane protein YphA (DoxX/SURF4 family)
MTRSIDARIRFAVAIIGAWLLWQATVFTHEKWFHDARHFPTQWGEVIRFPGIVAVILALAAVAGLELWWRLRGGCDLIPGPQALGALPDGRRGFYALVPLILGIHVGLPLIVLGIRGELFSPNNQIPGAWLYWVGVAQIGIGLCFLYGGLARLAGAALAMLWLVGIGLFGLEAMLENAHYLGFAAFFFLAGRGPHAVDRLLFPALEPAPHLARRAMPMLRIATALGLATVAFTEKLANPALAEAFLQRYQLNFTSWIGFPMSDRLFVLCAGATELIIGLALMRGLFPRVIIGTAWLFINMTLTMFSWVELLGHLPLYGVMGVLLIWTPDLEDQELWVNGILWQRERVVSSPVG